MDAPLSGAGAGQMPPAGNASRVTSIANARNTIPQRRGPDQDLPASAPPRQKTCSFGELTDDRDQPFIPSAPTSLEAAGLNASIVEELVARFLLNRGEASGRQIADQLRLPFRLIDPVLNRLKSEQMTVYRGANSVNDYTHSLTDQGRDRARRFNLRTTYYGAAPVALEEYCQAVKLQSVEGQNPKAADLARAFSDLLVCKEMVARLGPAINSGRGMFLYGYPGNGKTSIAERVTQTFGRYIWIPRSVIIDGEIMRLFDPLMHEVAESPRAAGLLDDSSVDRRWVRIKRPTIIAGGELTMEMLEVQKDTDTNINEAPLQLKSNCGVLVIDDFGRQKMRVDELLNRWIVPLEKRYDFLNMSSGKKTQVPFDQLVIFSTNLQPKDLVDDAFLRRIPYKIEVPNPSEGAFRKLFEIMAPKVGLPYRQDAVDHLVKKHYLATGRPMRNCHPRDLLLQVRNFCLYNDLQMEMLPEYFDYACENYFSIM
ncbi:MAG: AAA family ATPase [Aureliella sp.]